MNFYLTQAAYSSVGSREVNEDSYAIAQAPGRSMFILCDGLGGHGMGDVASQLVTSIFKNSFAEERKPEDYLAYCFEAAQETLLAEQRRRSAVRKMKTTAVVLAADRKKAYIAHVGDSRLYVFSKHKVLKRTIDHSIPQMLAISGEISEKEIRHHPDRSTILKVMGIPWEESMVEWMKPIPLRKCEAFLLCSDGFWEYIEDEDMVRLLEETNTAEEWIARMAALVKRNGAGCDMDNNTAVAVRIRRE